MTRGQGPFSVALSEVRSRLRRGDIPPGAILIIDDLAKSLDMSTTPVREALSRLVGEGLVAEDRGRGIYARRLDADDLWVLYGLHADVVDRALELTLALRSRLHRKALSPELLGELDDLIAKPQLAHATEVFWKSVVGASRNEDLLFRHAVLSDRLVMARTAEARVFAELESDLNKLRALAAEGSLLALRQASKAYHTARRRKVRIIIDRIGRE